MIVHDFLPRVGHASRGLVIRLIDLPVQIVCSGGVEKYHSLAERHPQRGQAVGLSKDAAVARATGAEPLAAAATGPGALGCDAETPLWYYVLKEAERHSQGVRPVGTARSDRVRGRRAALHRRTCRRPHGRRRVFEQLAREWLCVEEVALPKWPGTRDSLTVYRRRPQVFSRAEVQSDGGR